MKCPLKCELFYQILDSFPKIYSFCFSNPFAVEEELVLASKTKTDAYENDDLEKWPRKLKYIYIFKRLNTRRSLQGYSSNQEPMFSSKQEERNAYQFAFPPKFLFLSSMYQFINLFFQQKLHNCLLFAISPSSTRNTDMRKNGKGWQNLCLLENNDIFLVCVILLKITFRIYSIVLSHGQIYPSVD